MFLNVFKLNADREVVDDVADNVYQVSVGLALLEIVFGVVTVCNYTITICLNFGPFHFTAISKRGYYRENKHFPDF